MNNKENEANNEEFKTYELDNWECDIINDVDSFWEECNDIYNEELINKIKNEINKQKLNI